MRWIYFQKYEKYLSRTEYNIMYLNPLALILHSTNDAHSSIFIAQQHINICMHRDSPLFDIYSCVA